MTIFWLILKLLIDVFTIDKNLYLITLFILYPISSTIGLGNFRIYVKEKRDWFELAPITILTGDLINSGKSAQLT